MVFSVVGTIYLLGNVPGPLHRGHAQRKGPHHEVRQEGVVKVLYHLVCEGKPPTHKPGQAVKEEGGAESETQNGVGPDHVPGRAIRQPHSTFGRLLVTIHGSYP